MIIARPLWQRGRVQPAYDQAFIIMPFREKWSDYIYRDYLVPLLAQHGVKAVRADEMYGRNVLTDIWDGIAASRFTIADVSMLNENVFYELGIAHTIGKPTILLTQAPDRIPFDLRNQRIIIYSDDHPGYETLKSALPKHLAAVLAEPIDEYHHVTSIIGGFVVEQALQKIHLDANDTTSAWVTDYMSAIAVRDNGVILNKYVKTGGTVTDISCSHAFTFGSYPDIKKLTAVFEPPYFNTGDKAQITFRYYVARGFESNERYWYYEVQQDTEQLTFELLAPTSFDGAVKLVKSIQPTDYDIKALMPMKEDGHLRFVGEVEHPELGATYALRWVES